MTEYGKHKAVLWGNLVTTAPEVEAGDCAGCAFDSCCVIEGVEQRGAGFGDCSSNRHIYVEAQPDDPSAEEAKPDPSATQVGGDHYTRMAVQPWDALEAWLTPEQFTGFLLGSAVAYLARVNVQGVAGKGGTQDVKKAIHYLQKMIGEGK